MPNQYVNKVVYGNDTLIDITDTTAVASDVASGKYFYTADGAKVEGAAVVPPEVLIVDTTLQNGSIYRNITTMQNGVSLQTSKTISSITSPQTVTVDSGYDGFADGMTLNVTEEFTTLCTLSVYVGDYVKDSPIITTGKLSLYSRHIYGL